MKKLYRQFNRLKLDEDVEPIKVSELEQARIKKEVMRQRKKQLPKTLSAAIILVSIIALSFTLSVANPVFAEKIPIIGNIFELFSDNEKEYIFEDYDKHSTKLDMTHESNGIEITLTEAVYDGENVTIAYTMKSAQDLGDEPFIDAQFSIGKNNDFNYIAGSQMSEKVSEKEYAGLFMIYLMDGEWPEDVQVNWEAQEIGEIDSTTGSMIHSIEGIWSFELNLGEIKGRTEDFESLMSKEDGLEVALKQIARTPISTSYYFQEKTGASLKNLKDEEWETVLFDYDISDNLGNEYTVVPNASWGNNDHILASRVITTNIAEEAMSIKITPRASIYKMKDEGSEGELELVQEPIELETIEVQLDKD